MHAANRKDPAPRARWSQVVAAWWSEVWVALAVFCWRQPFRHASIPDWLPEPPVPGAEVPRGVVLVHGFMCNRGFWLPWLPRLRALGHDILVVEPVAEGVLAHPGPPLTSASLVMADWLDRNMTWLLMGIAATVTGSPVENACRLMTHQMPDGGIDRTVAVVDFGASTTTFSASGRTTMTS